MSPPARIGTTSGTTTSRQTGPITGLVSAGSGYSSAYILNVRVAPALAQLLVAGGISGIDVGVSARELALFYIDEDVPLWRQVLTIMRTAGPRARLFELGDGRLRFRDEATPPVSRTIRGRLSGLAVGGLVSAVPNDDAGRERVVNSVDLGSFRGGSSGASLVGSAWGVTETVGTARRLLVSAEVLGGLTPQAGDTLLAFYQASVEAPGFSLGVQATSSLFMRDGNTGNIVYAGGGGTVRTVTSIGYMEWPGEQHVRVNSIISSDDRVNALGVLLLRGGGTLIRRGTGQAVERGSLMVASWGHDLRECVRAYRHHTACGLDARAR